MTRKVSNVILDSESLETFMYNALNKIQLAIMRGNANGELEEVAKKYGVLDLLQESEPYCDFYKNNPRKACILVLAISLPNIDEWRMRAKKKGIPSDRIEFRVVKPNFDYSHLANTSAYSDIIVGPVHHKGVGIEENSSFLAAVANHPEDYPKVHRMTDSNGVLTLSQAAFERCLDATNFIKECLI